MLDSYAEVCRKNPSSTILEVTTNETCVAFCDVGPRPKLVLIILFSDKKCPSEPS